MNGLTRDAKHVYRWNDGEPLPSVTTILQVVDKSGPLVGWAKRITAEAAVDNAAQIAGWVEMAGRDGAVRLLTAAATTKRDRAANAGSEVHAIAEAITRGHDPEIAEELAPFVAAYRQWMADFDPEFIAAEEMVANLAEGYAGTLDAIVRIAGETWLLDYKTSKGVYAETAMQLAAYANAEFIGRPGSDRKFRIPLIDQFGVLHLRPEGYEMVPFAVTEATYAAFLAAKAVREWREGEATRLIGQAIGPQLLRFPSTHAPAKEAIA